MSERMDEQEARATLLEMLQERVAESQREGEETLELKTGDFEQFGKVLGWNVSEASALYKRLVRGGFVRQYRGETSFLEFDGVLRVVWVDDLTDEGLKAIGVLDPTEALVEALRAAIQDIEDSEDIPEDKKTDVISWLDRGITVARIAEGAAQIINRHLGTGA